MGGDGSHPNSRANLRPNEKLKPGEITTTVRVTGANDAVVWFKKLSRAARTEALEWLHRNRGRIR